MINKKGLLLLVFFIIGAILLFILKEKLSGAIILFLSTIATGLDKNLREVIISFFVSLFKKGAHMTGDVPKEIKERIGE